MTNFARRQFDAAFFGTVIPGSPEEFVETINTLFSQGKATWQKGYAPFCMHLFVYNFTDAMRGVAAITDENRHLLRSGYRARRDSELPILTRWFEGLKADRAPFLDVILYSKEQIEKEGTEPPFDGDWGIVSVLTCDLPEETPMPPITMMRNALGVSEGGSGVPLDREAYKRAVEFWECHATVI